MKKIYVLKASDGRTRVITGSVNMSSSAFNGVQRENIICFDDKEAYEYYMNRFSDFKNQCSDSVPHEAMKMFISDEDYFNENIEEVPILKTIEKKTMIFLEDSENDTETELVAGIKGFESELRPLLPKENKSEGRIMLSGEYVKKMNRKYNENRQIKEAKEKKLPKLHINFESKTKYVPYIILLFEQHNREAHK